MPLTLQALCERCAGTNESSNTGIHSVEVTQLVACIQAHFAAHIHGSQCPVAVSTFSHMMHGG
jgi:hypothetical protein